MAILEAALKGLLLVEGHAAMLVQTAFNSLSFLLANVQELWFGTFHCVSQHGRPALFTHK